MKYIDKELTIKYMLEGQFGLEKESLRVNEEGFLAQTKHPFENNPNIDRDFCESQTEIITEVCDSIEEAYEQLEAIHRTVVTTIYNLKSGKEFVWPFSNPPYVENEENIHIATFDEKLKGKEIYREYLSKKYGKRKMLFSGIHLNFSFSDACLKYLFESGDYNSYREFKDKLYLELAKKITKYTWIIVFLTAASPLMDGSFIKDEDIGKDILSKYASARCSDIGYWNEFIPLLKYDGLDTYVNSIQNYIDDGQLNSSAELYYPVRLKPKGENTLENLVQSGVNHIELRMLDLNPLSPIGIIKEDMYFIQMLIIYLMFLEDETFEDFEQIMAIKNAKKSALYDEKEILLETGWNKSNIITEETLKTLNNMEIFYKDLSHTRAKEIIDYQKRKILHPDERYAVKIRNQFYNKYVEKGMIQAKEYSIQIVDK